MPKLSSLRDFWRRNLVIFFTALVVVAADQISKLLVRSNLALGHSLPETGLFQIIHTYNTGAAFGLFADHSVLLIAIDIIGICLILFLAIFFHGSFHFLSARLGKLSLGLIFGGTVGNLIDRLSSGYVTDFIDIGIWPVFNIADSSVVVGALLLAYLIIKGR